MNIFQRVRFGLAKAAARVAGLTILPAWIRHSFTRYTFLSLVNEGLKGNATVYACLRVLTRHFPEPQLWPYVLNDVGDEEKIPNHALRKLMKRPNPDMGEAEYYAYCIMYAALGGNVYQWKQRGGNGQVVALWPFHDGHMQPIPGRGTADGMVAYYVLDVGDGSSSDIYNMRAKRFDALGGVAIPKTEIVQWKWMIDPAQPWRGIGALEASAKDIDTANELRQLIYSLLKNDAKPPVVINLMEGEQYDEDKAERLRKQWQQRYGGENRGLPAFLEAGMKVTELGFDLQELQVDSLMDGPDAAICSGFGIHPMVVGALIGLKRSTLSNYAEARRALAEDTLVPLWRSFASEFEQAMANEPGFSEDEMIHFDTSHVAALQQNANELWARVTAAYDSGFLMRSEARTVLGYRSGSGDDVYKIGLATILEPGGMKSKTALLGQGQKMIPPDGDEPEGDEQDTVLPHWVKMFIKKGGGGLPAPSDMVSENGNKAAPNPDKFFDYGFASRIKEDWPQIWSRGGNERGNETFQLWTRWRDGERTEAINYWIETERPAWGARHHEDFRLAGVVAQMKWGWVGSRGVDYMKGVINDEIERLSEKFRRDSFWTFELQSSADEKQFPQDDGGASARRADPDLYQRQRRAINALRQSREAVLPRATELIASYFADYGRRAEAAVRQFNALPVRRIALAASNMPQKEFDEWFEDVREFSAKEDRKQLTRADIARLDELLYGQESPERLQAILETITLQTSEASWDTLNILLGSTLQFTTNDPAVVAALEKAGGRVVNITDSTRSQLQELLQYGYENGWAIEDFVMGDALRPGIGDFITETYSGRSETIARTEIGTAQATTSAERYARSGVSSVVIFDNGFENSHPTCVQLDGTVQSLDWYSKNPLQHPNCVRAAGPYYEGG